MTVGSILLSGAAIALLLGVGQRVLDKMHLTDRAALIIIAAMFVGGLLPDIDSAGRMCVFACAGRK